MSTPRRRPRRGFTLVIVLATLAIVLYFVAALAALIVQEFRTERQCVLESCVEQMACSAQAWCRQNPDALSEETIVLPMNQLLREPTTGSVELDRTSTDNGDFVTCHVTIEHSGRRLRRLLTWPVSASASVDTPTPHRNDAQTP